MSPASNGLTNTDPTTQSPLHGNQGDRATASPRPRIPASLTITISRETGARGATIAHRVGEKLGWQVYSQDLLEYSLQDERLRQNVLDSLPSEAAQWVEERLSEFSMNDGSEQNAAFMDLVRLVLVLGAQGEVILIGRGAGYILPRASTLFIRAVSPLAERVAYMSQWMRLTQDEAVQQLRARDRRREDYIQRHFQVSPGDVHFYDLLLNTSYLGEELCTELIIQAARAKLSAMLGNSA